MAQQLDHCTMLIIQLQSMEIEYLTELNYLMEKYLLPLKSIICDKEHHILFANIDSIIKIHTNYDIAREMEQNKKDNSNQRNAIALDDIISNLCKAFEPHYLRYFGGYCNSKQLLQHLCKNNAKFFNFCQHVRKTNKNNNDLSLLLQLPFAYILKIHHKISDMARNSSEISLQECCSILSHLSSKCKQMQSNGNTNINDVNQYLNHVHQFVMNQKYYTQQLQSNVLNVMHNTPCADIIHSIHRFHVQFIDSIECRANYLKHHQHKQHSDGLFADSWTNFICVLSLYRKVMDLYDDIRSFCNQTSNAHNIMFSIQSICLQIIKYQRWFQNMCTCVGNNQTQDYIQLTNCIHCITSLRHEMKAKLQQMDASFRLSLIENKLDQASLTLYNKQKHQRRYLFEGYLMKLSTVSQRNKIYLFILYTDCLLYCSLNQTPLNGNLCTHNLNEYKFCNTQIHIHRLLDLNNGATSIIDYPAIPPNGNPCAFALLTVTESFIVCAQDIEKKKHWVSLLNGIIYNNVINVNERMDRPCTLFLPFSFSNECMMEQCNNSQHLNHCRSCGRIVCEECCDGKINSYQTPKNLIRVCKECKVYCGSNGDEDALIDDDDEDVDLFCGATHGYRDLIPNQVKPRPNKKVKLNL
eukprot:282138_1